MFPTNQINVANKQLILQPSLSKTPWNTCLLWRNYSCFSDAVSWQPLEVYSWKLVRLFSQQKGLVANLSFAVTQFLIYYFLYSLIFLSQTLRHMVSLVRCYARSFSLVLGPTFSVPPWGWTNPGSPSPPSSLPVLHLHEHCSLPCCFFRATQLTEDLTA